MKKRLKRDSAASLDGAKEKGKVKKEKAEGLKAQLMVREARARARPRAPGTQDEKKNEIEENRNNSDERADVIVTSSKKFQYKSSLNENLLL